MPRRPWATIDQFDPCYGSITIDGVDMHRLGWTIPTLEELWGTPDQRGSDRLIPHVVGVKPYKRRNSVTRFSLPLHIVGSHDENDAPASSLAQAYVFFESNMTYLQTNVLLPTNLGDGTRSLAWTLPSGRVITVDVHVLPFSPALLPGAQARGTLELSVPNGDLHL